MNDPQPTRCMYSVERLDADGEWRTINTTWRRDGAEGICRRNPGWTTRIVEVKP